VNAGTNKALPWFRHPWVWLLIAIPATSVVMGVIILVLAIRSDDGLVADDYYQRGRAINRVLERDHAAAALGLEAILEFDFARRSVAVRLLAREGYAPPARLTLGLLHPTRAGQDQSVVLAHRGAGRYVGTLAPVGEGRWYLQLETADWRLLGRLDVPGIAMVHIVPAPAPAG